MDPITAILPSLLAAIPGLAKSGVGIGQMISGNKYADQFKAPSYEIPPALLEMVNNMKGLASQTSLPGEAKITEGIQSNTAQGINALKELSSSSTDAISGLTPLMAKENKAITNLGIAGAERQDQNIARLNAALDELAKAQDIQWLNDKYAPYAAAMDASKRLQESGTLNFNSGLSDTAGVGAYLAKGFIDNNNKDITSNINKGVISGGNMGMPSDMETLQKYFPNIDFGQVFDSLTNLKPS